MVRCKFLVVMNGVCNQIWLLSIPLIPNLSLFLVISRPSDTCIYAEDLSLISLKGYSPAIGGEPTLGILSSTRFLIIRTYESARNWNHQQHHAVPFFVLDCLWPSFAKFELSIFGHSIAIAVPLNSINSIALNPRDEFPKLTIPRSQLCISGVQCRNTDKKPLLIPTHRCISISASRNRQLVGATYPLG